MYVFVNVFVITDFKYLSERFRNIKVVDEVYDFFPQAFDGFSDILLDT